MNRTAQRLATLEQENRELRETVDRFRRLVNRFADGGSAIVLAILTVAIVWCTVTVDNALPIALFGGTCIWLSRRVNSPPMTKAFLDLLGTVLTGTTVIALLQYFHH